MRTSASKSTLALVLSFAACVGLVAAESPASALGFRRPAAKTQNANQRVQKAAKPAATPKRGFNLFRRRAKPTSAAPAPKAAAPKATGTAVAIYKPAGLPAVATPIAAAPPILPRNVPVKRPIVRKAARMIIVSAILAVSVIGIGKMLATPTVIEDLPAIADVVVEVLAPSPLTDAPAPAPAASSGKGDLTVFNQRDAVTPIGGKTVRR